jgi:hypothetical protein
MRKIRERFFCKAERNEIILPGVTDEFAIIIAPSDDVYDLSRAAFSLNSVVFHSIEDGRQSYREMLSDCLFCRTIKYIIIIHFG